MKGDKLIPYGVIVAAKSGDSEAMSQILRHYEPYIIRCSRRTFYDEYGNRYQVVDEEIKNRIQAKLMYQIIYLNLRHISPTQKMHLKLRYIFLPPFGTGPPIPAGLCGLVTAP